MQLVQAPERARSAGARAALCAEAAGLERGRCKRAGRTSGKECLHHGDQANCEMYRPSSVQKLGSARRAGRECMRARTPVHGKQQNAWPTKQAAYAFAPPCTHPCCSCASHGRSGQPAARPCEAAGQRTTMWKGEERSPCTVAPPVAAAATAYGSTSKVIRRRPKLGLRQRMHACPIVLHDSLGALSSSSSALHSRHALHSPCCVASRVLPSWYRNYLALKTSKGLSRARRRHAEPRKSLQL